MKTKTSYVVAIDEACVADWAYERKDDWIEQRRQQWSYEIAEYDSIYRMAYLNFFVHFINHREDSSTAE